MQYNNQPIEIISSKTVFGKSITKIRILATGQTMARCQDGLLRGREFHPIARAWLSVLGSRIIGNRWASHHVKGIAAHPRANALPSPGGEA